MESGKECSNYDQFAGKYLKTAANANECIKKIKALQLDFDYMVFKSDTQECIFLFGACTPVDKAGSDLYYLTEDCWAEDIKVHHHKI